MKHRRLNCLPSIALFVEQQERTTFCKVTNYIFLLPSKSLLYPSATKTILVCEATADISKNASEQGGSRPVAIFCAVTIAQYRPYTGSFCNLIGSARIPAETKGQCQENRP